MNSAADWKTKFGGKHMNRSCYDGFLFLTLLSKLLEYS